MTIPAEIQTVLDDAQRGHRIHEYERLTYDLVRVITAHFNGLDREPHGAVEKMAYWARQVVDNDGRLTADSSMSLDMAHDELAKAIDDYLDKGATTGPVQPKTLEQMQTDVTEWCERKGWRGEGSAPVTFGDTMALLHSEVSEALEAYRDWGLNDATAHYNPSEHGYNCAWGATIAKGPRESSPCDCEFGEGKKPEGVGSEFADVLIRLLDDCDRYGVDLRFEFERKMAYNERRPYQHGGRIL